MDEAKGLQAKKLLEILWTYKTTYKNNTGETLFDLAFGVVVIPVEVGLFSFKFAYYDKQKNDKHMQVGLDLIEKK